MADRNDHRSTWSGGGEDSWRNASRRGREEHLGGREDRSFSAPGRDEGRYGAVRGGHGEGEGEPWRRDRYGSRYDQDRTNYGSGWDRNDYGRGSYDRGGDRSFDRERRNFRPGGGPRDDYRTAWHPSRGAPYGDMELDAGGRGYEEYGAPADYAYHPHREFEPDYLHWRDEQLRLHDRDYAEWRRNQHQQYDEDYRRYKSERRSDFGQTFQQWRAQRNQSTGMPAQHIGPETHDYHRRTGAGFGQGQDRPSGSLESPTSMTPSPALSQGGGGAAAEGSSRGRGDPTDGDAGFGQESAQVQSVTDGSDGRKDAEDREEDRRQH